MICDNLKMLHSCEEYFAAQTIANISSSIMAYRDSAVLRKRDPACTSTHLPAGVCCCRTNPMPCLLASVHRRVVQCMSKYANKGLSDRCCLAVASA